jgi:hypothetical protein
MFMKHYIHMLVCTLSILVSSVARGDCNSCNISTTNASCCSKNDCVKFERKTQAFCALLAQEFEAETSYTNNTTFRNLRVLGNEQVNGSLIVNGEVTVLNDLIITGELVNDGSAVEPIGLSQYAFFTYTLTTVIADDAIIPFNTAAITPTAGITNVAGVITVAEAGTYMINFAVTGGVVNESWTLVSDPAGTPVDIVTTNFAQGVDGVTTAGMVLLTLTAGQSIGVRNINGGPTTVTTAAVGGADPNVAAAITIVKIN